MFTGLFFGIGWLYEISQSAKDPDLFNLLAHQDSVMSQAKGINKLNEWINWEWFREELESLLGYVDRDAKRGGRPPFDPVLIPKWMELLRGSFLRICLKSHLL